MSVTTMADLDENISDTDSSSDASSVDSYDRYHASLLAHACEWCSQDQRSGICNGRGKECRDMASYRQAQLCARMNCLCQDTIRTKPIFTSLQTRIVDAVQKCVHTKRNPNVLQNLRAYHTYLAQDQSCNAKVLQHVVTQIELLEQA